MAYTPKSGFHYFFQGLRLIQNKSIAPYVWIPIVVNLILFILLWGLMIHWASIGLQHIDRWLPVWLVWLNFLIWPLFFLLLFAMTAYCFTLLANWIAAPFLGVLSERVQLLLEGEPLPEVSWSQTLAETPSILGRQLRLALYYLPRAIVLLIILFIPGLNALSGVLWFCFGSWMLAIQYLDYPLDNNKRSYHDLMAFAKNHRWDSFTFGVCAFVGTMIPVLNLFIIPAAVAGATAFWVDTQQNMQ